ncbi:protein transport protein Sec16A-like isoform X2 [Antennarius striatus]|uniref:protein transport protein Sec16A-like isoform X2 n=1 Tax=Antennarius striatus TaxID=241820 RepID=UPI0035B02C8A
MHHDHITGTTSTMPPATQPITEPFGFVRAHPPMAAGGIPTIPHSHPLPLQTPKAMHSPAGPGLPPQQQDVGLATSLPGVALNPHYTASHNVLQGPSGVEYTPSSHIKQGYFNSREQTMSMAPESLHVAPASVPSQTPFNRELQGPPPPKPLQPVPPTVSFSQWGPDHRSRPPLVQNCFLPTSDSPPRPFNLPPQAQMHPSHTLSPHHNIPTLVTQPVCSQAQAPLPLQNSVKAPDSHPNAHPLHNSQNRSYFGQRSAPQATWFNRHPQDSGYHQMGSSLSYPQPRPDYTASQHVSNPRPGPGPSAAPAPGSCSQETDMHSMFFKDVEAMLNSANSSVKPVHSHGVRVNLPDVYRPDAMIEMGADSTPGNLEHLPDNMESIYRTGQPLHSVPGDGVPHLTYPGVHSHSQLSSCVLGANQTCKSPTPRPWAQKDPSSLGANIVLQPMASTVPAPLQEPSGDVIQPPEDSPLDLQSSLRIRPTSQQSENLENPPKVSEKETADSQCEGGVADVADVSDSLQQPILIVKPVSSDNLIPQSGFAQSASHSSVKQSTPPMGSHPQGQGAGPSQSPLLTSSHNPLIAAGHLSYSSSVSGLVPLNLARDKTDVTKLDVTVSAQHQPICCPASSGQAGVGQWPHSALQGNLPASFVASPISNHNQPSKYQLLDFSIQQPQTQSQVSGYASSVQEVLCSTTGFYLQATKDVQQGLREKGTGPVQTLILSSAKQGLEVPRQGAVDAQPPPTKPPNTSDSQAALQRQNVDPPVRVSGGQTPHGQFSTPPQGSTKWSAPPPSSSSYPIAPQGPAPPGAPLPTLAQPPQPPFFACSQQGYGPSPPGPGPMDGGYYGNNREFPESRAPYHPGQYPPPPVDPRLQQCYQDSYSSRSDPSGGRYGQPPAYPNYQNREPQPQRTSQHSNRPSFRLGYPDDYQRANRSAYNDYDADYTNYYDCGGYNYGQYDPQYWGHYEQANFSSYDDTCRGRDNYYIYDLYYLGYLYYMYYIYYTYNYSPRTEEHGEHQQCNPWYSASLDDDYQCRGEMHLDDFDRGSVHRERSAHSSHSHHNRQGSFSSGSQQSQDYRRQPEVVSAVYDNHSSTLAVNNSYGQPKQNQPHAPQNYCQYLYPSEHTADSTCIVTQQHKSSPLQGSSQAHSGMAPPQSVPKPPFHPVPPSGQPGRMPVSDPGRRSRTTSQSSSDMASGRSCRTTSESSTYSGGSERSNYSSRQGSPPPSPIHEPLRNKQVKEAKKDCSKKGGGLVKWFKSLLWVERGAVHLPDDTNPSSKPPPRLPPSEFRMMPQKTGPEAPSWCPMAVFLSTTSTEGQTRGVDTWMS